MLEQYQFRNKEEITVRNEIAYAFINGYPE